VYRWIDHTSEVEIAIEAASERGVFDDATSALADLLGFAEAGSAVTRRHVSVGAPDRPAQLAAWLEELVYLAESEGFVATRVEELSLNETSLSAVVAGFLDDPSPIVKAVTYHRLEFSRSGDGYVANVILDV
jgi:protein archease